MNKNQRFCSRKCGNSSNHKNPNIYLAKKMQFIFNNPMKNEKSKEKALKTCLEKYGCKNLEELNFYKKIKTKWKNYIIPLFELKDYHGKNFIYKWKCVKCGNEFEQRIYNTKHKCDIDPYLPRCLNCYPPMVGKSGMENELFTFCKQYFPNLIEHENKNVRNFIKNNEIDIIIPEIKLALEFNGIKFHSIEGIAKWKKYYISGYHLNKTLKCEEKGYRLIHIWENDWIDYKEEIENRLGQIFKGEEDLNFNEDILKLDRCWYSKLQKIPGYELIEETKPEIEIRKNLHIENCGYLIFKKLPEELF